MTIADDTLDTALVGAKNNAVRLPQDGFGQLLRVAMMLIVCCAVVALAVVILWLVSWNQDGLPDIGDPQEIAAARALVAGDNQNTLTS